MQGRNKTYPPHTILGHRFHFFPALAFSLQFFWTDLLHAILKLSLFQFPCGFLSIASRLIVACRQNYMPYPFVFPCLNKFCHRGQLFPSPQLFIRDPIWPSAIQSSSQTPVHEDLKFNRDKFRHFPGLPAIKVQMLHWFQNSGFSASPQLG